MPEVIIKYKNAKALKALQDLTKLLDFTIESSVSGKSSKSRSEVPDLPITFAKKPDVKALAGIWQDREITLADLRKDAWGDRI